MGQEQKTQKSKEQPDHEQSYMSSKEFLFNFMEDGLLTFFFFFLLMGTSQIRALDRLLWWHYRLKGHKTE